MLQPDQKTQLGHENSEALLVPPSWASLSLPLLCSLAVLEVFNGAVGCGNVY